MQEIAELKAVPDDRLDELREAVADLQERAETADHRMWREIDQLQDRIDREELLASGSNGVADDLGAKAAASGGEVDGAKLMAALEELSELDDEVVGRLMEHLPGDLDAELKQMLADAAAPDGRFDLDALPEDAATQAALADAVAEALEGMRSELGSEMSEQLAELALEMAKSGGLQQLPDALREAMLEAGLSALEEMDLEQLRAMMPEDLAQLSELAKGLAEAAKGLDLGEGGGQLSAESREKMAALADGLLKQMSGREIGQWQQLMQQAQVAAGQVGQRHGLGTENGGHAALRLTGGSRGDAAASDLVLPARKPSELANEWVPVMIGKAEPETGQKRAAGVGRAGATGTGGAAWQLRLRPRHRDVVRRFFAEKKQMTTMLTNEQVARGQQLLASIRDGANSVLLGQNDLVELCLVALCARGHLLLEGLPGLGKTELVKALATLTGLQFRRLQFTPDLLPSDITGGPILQERDGQRELEFRPGPLFANLVLADEINRSSPKTQSALLEGMQESSVTVLGETHALPEPFFVLATQNPIELEGTYPLPEAQLDRFLFKVEVPGLDAETMSAILTSRRRGQPPTVAPALQPGELAELFELVDTVFLPDAIAKLHRPLGRGYAPGLGWRWESERGSSLRGFAASSDRHW